MAATTYIGYALIGLGVIIILFSLLLGYGIYVSASSNLNDIALISPSGGNTINGSVSILSSNLQSTATTGTYAAIEVIVLFLFASIGYKLAYLGIQMNKQSGKQEKQVQAKS